MSGGGSTSKCARLCRLIDDSLRPYAVSVAFTLLEELDVVPMTKEKEKEILIALSQVFRQVQLWNQEFDSDSDNDSVLLLDCESGCSSGSGPHYEEIQCLSKILADLIVLLTFESRYVQHLATNVLVVVSEFVAASGRNWDAFIHLLCGCLDTAITIKLTFDSAPSPTGADDSNFGSSSFVIKLKQKLKDANWSTAASIVRVLRTILKIFNTENDVQFLTFYFDSVSSCLSNVPWDLLTQICVPPNVVQKSSGADALFHRSVFLGNFTQFLCSLVEQSYAVEAAGDSAKKRPDLQIIINFVPKLLNWCLGKQGDCVNTCILLYFRHKLLVLMIRLSFRTSLDCSILVSWLGLMHAYFSEYLQQSMTSLKAVQGDCLEGSPFLLSVSDTEVNNLCSHHVQRLAVFLFLRCSLGLISLKSDNDEKCACASQNLCLPSESNVNLECCGRKKGILELYNWLQGHLPVSIFVDHNIYLQKCIDFALSFLQLYMHEDDLLFKVLLQLFCVPFPAERWFQNLKGDLHNAKGDMLFHVSNVFNPVHLFHLFLLELHYDHQVLLDYLISKDTGISCAEYLLRCLRMVCDSWHSFVQFSVGGQNVNQSSCKKRKWDGSLFQTEKSSSSVKNDRTSTILEKECNEHKYGCKDNQTIGQRYMDAKECLLSLKISVESLHQKDLFPYNPKVLLKRLTRFQELCLRDEQNYL
ncbi:uncharacterized protein LOC107424715 isoform X1 [Ziziphus jujuba]|uniref:Uncharacterized protein LOC107424715 isoform X1 n=1 Tax=Ziziphus jujuba TaxID=326968 RepID=A0A6P6GFI4_ZIZJJ|nr:uncharacterized protein LOC107424715 isoform X1 [Ziziphus jujuba]